MLRGAITISAHTPVQGWFSIADLAPLYWELMTQEHDHPN